MPKLDHLLMHSQAHRATSKLYHTKKFSLQPNASTNSQPCHFQIPRTTTKSHPPPSIIANWPQMPNQTESLNPTKPTETQKKNPHHRLSTSPNHSSPRQSTVKTPNDVATSSLSHSQQLHPKTHSNSSTARNPKARPPQKELIM